MSIRITSETLRRNGFLKKKPTKKNSQDILPAVRVVTHFEMVKRLTEERILKAIDHGCTFPE